MIKTIKMINGQNDQKEILYWRFQSWFFFSDGSKPTPEEVIVLDDQFQADQPDTKIIPRRTIASKSSAHLDNNQGEEGGTEVPLLPPAKSEPKISNGFIDNNFSPFRSKNAAQNGPKMKVFLPSTKNSFEDDEDEDDSSSASSVSSSPVKEWNVFLVLVH